MAIKYYLQPNPITPDPNDRSARVECDTLDVNDIIKLMLRRGTMVTETDIRAILQLFFDVVAEQAVDGSAVNLPITNLRPSIKGVFRDANDTFDPSRHKITTSISAGLLLNQKMATAKVEKVSTSLPMPILHSYEDVNSATMGAMLTPGGIGRIIGEELKFDTSQEDEGIFFVNSDGNAIRAAVMATVTEGQLMFMVPELTMGDYRLEVRRAYTGNRTIRKGSLYLQLTVGGVTE